MRIVETVSADLLDVQPQEANPWDNGIGYALATILLRLPGHAPMLAFNHIVDIPLIVPRAKLSKEQVCHVDFLHGQHIC